MKPVKYALLAAPLIALVTVFALRYLTLNNGDGLTLWQYGAMGNPHAKAVLVLMLIPLGAGIFALARRLARWQAVVSAVAFAAAIFMSYAVFMKTKHAAAGGAIGSKLMFGALAIGLVAALVGSVRPERAG